MSFHPGTVRIAADKGQAVTRRELAAWRRTGHTRRGVRRREAKAGDRKPAALSEKKRLYRFRRPGPCLFKSSFSSRGNTRAIPQGNLSFLEGGGEIPLFIAGYICENSSSSSLERKRLVPIRARCARGTETFFLALAQSVSEFHGLFTHGPFRQRISIHQAIAVNGSANRFALNSVKYSYKLGTVS